MRMKMAYTNSTWQEQKKRAVDYETPTSRGLVGTSNKSRNDPDAPITEDLAYPNLFVYKTSGFWPEKKNWGLMKSGITILNFGRNLQL